jgi:hypothetical protein
MPSTPATSHTLPFSRSRKQLGRSRLWFDKRGAVAVVEAVDVLIAAALHDGVGAGSDARLRLAIADHGALVLDDLATPRNVLAGEQAVAGNGRFAHDETIVGAFDLLHAGKPVRWRCRDRARCHAGRRLSLRRRERAAAVSDGRVGRRCGGWRLWPSMPGRQTSHSKKGGMAGAGYWATVDDIGRRPRRQYALDPR